MLAKTATEGHSANFADTQHEDADSNILSLRNACFMDARVEGNTNMSSHKRRLDPFKESTLHQQDAIFNSSSFLCGLLTGVAQAAVFNPYDRALYLSIKEKRSFLSWMNWKSPYSGFFQSLGGRALSGGLYFPLEHMFLSALDCESKSLRNFFAGTLAGAANAIVLNPLTAIKYKTWGREVNHGMWTEARQMLQKAGVRPFLNGVTPTLYRDIVFGGCHTWLRLQILIWLDLPPQHHWMANIVAAALATVASGPFNYARNMQYATPSKQRALPTWIVLRELIVDSSHQPTRSGQIMYLVTRLRIGWGTARVSLGMAFGHSVYDRLHRLTHQR